MQYKIKIIIVIITLNSSCISAYSQISLTKQDPNNLTIFNAKKIIRKKEGLTLVYKKGLGHKEKIIGYGDYICKTRYKNVTNITEQQAMQCLHESVLLIYKSVKKKLPGLNYNQYSALISLIFNVGYDNFYNSRLFKLVQNKSKKIRLIRYEWLDFCHVNHKPVDGILKRRAEELELFFKVIW